MINIRETNTVAIRGYLSAKYIVNQTTVKHTYHKRLNPTKRVEHPFQNFYRCSVLSTIHIGLEQCTYILVQAFFFVDNRKLSCV